MPRVLFVAPSAYPLGGVAVWLDYVARGLTGYGWEVKVGLVAGHHHDVNRYLTAYPELPWFAIDNPSGSAEGRMRALIDAIKTQAPDVVVGVNIADLFGACQRLRKRRTRVLRVAMALHGIAADLLGDLKRERNGIDAVFATNKLACRMCTDSAGMPPERVFYSPYGVDFASLNTLRRLPGMESFRIACVGRLDHPQKRVEDLPVILEQLDKSGLDYRLQVVGDGPARDWLLSALSVWINNGRVEYVGVVPPQDLGERIYAQSDVLLVTSSWETGPIVIWEAMAVGVPVVTSRYIGLGLEQALSHKENCLMFSVGDVEEAAKQIRTLAHTDIAETIATGGKRLVKERYSIDRSVKAWANCLDAICRKPPIEGDGIWPRPPARGRLDRLVGTGLAESLRRYLRISFQHNNAGGEWPHTLSPEQNDGAFLRLARELDRA